VLFLELAKHFNTFFASSPHFLVLLFLPLLATHYYI